MAEKEDDITVYIPLIKFTPIILPLSRSLVISTAKIFATMALLLMSVYLSAWDVIYDVKVNEFQLSKLFPFKHTLAISVIRWIVGIFLFIFLYKILRARVTVILKKIENGKIAISIAISITASITILVSAGPFLISSSTIEKISSQNLASSDQAEERSGTSPAPSGVNMQHHSVDEALDGCKKETEDHFICKSKEYSVNVERKSIMKNGTKVGEALIFSMGQEYSWVYGKSEILKMSSNIPDINENIKSDPISRIINNSDIMYYVGTASHDGGVTDQIYLSNQRSNTMKSIIQRSQNHSNKVINCTVSMGRYENAGRDHESQRPLIFVAAYQDNTSSVSVPQQRWTNEEAENLFWNVADEIDTGQFSLGVRLSGYYSYKNRDRQVNCR